MMIRAYLFGGTLLVLVALADVQAKLPMCPAIERNLQYTGKLTQLDVKKRTITVLMPSRLVLCSSSMPEMVLIASSIRLVIPVSISSSDTSRASHQDSARPR